MLKFCGLWIPAVFVTAAALAAPPQNWRESARQFSGESSASRSKAIANLRKELTQGPELEAALRSALDDRDLPLALDVISTLQLPAFLPDLLRRSETDATGFTYNAINALVNDGNRDRITQIYLERVTRERTPFTSKGVLLHTLARLHARIKSADLERLLTDESFEVRSAALYYLRFFVVRLQESEYLPLLSLNLKRRVPYQLKLQTLTLITELAPGPRARTLRSLRGQIEDCKKDEQPELQALCIRLGGEN